MDHTKIDLYPVSRSNHYKKITKTTSNINTELEFKRYENEACLLSKSSYSNYTRRKLMRSNSVRNKLNRKYSDRFDLNNSHLNNSHSYQPPKGIKICFINPLDVNFPMPTSRSESITPKQKNKKHVKNRREQHISGDSSNKSQKIRTKNSKKSANANNLNIIHSSSKNNSQLPTCGSGMTRDQISPIQNLEKMIITQTSTSQTSPSNLSAKSKISDSLFSPLTNIQNLNFLTAGEEVENPTENSLQEFASDPLSSPTTNPLNILPNTTKYFIYNIDLLVKLKNCNPHLWNINSLQPLNSTPGLGNSNQNSNRTTPTNYTNSLDSISDNNSNHSSISSGLDYDDDLYAKNYGINSSQNSSNNSDKDRLGLNDSLDELHISPNPVSGVNAYNSSLSYSQKNRHISNHPHQKRSHKISQKAQNDLLFYNVNNKILTESELSNFYNEPELLDRISLLKSLIKDMNHILLDNLESRENLRHEQDAKMTDLEDIQSSIL